MITIVKNLVDPEMMYYKGIGESKGRRWQFITVHNTANDAAAAAEVSYMRRNYDYTSFHYAVDDRQAVQGLPDDIGAFDTSNRSFSAAGLSVEICYSLSGGSRFTAAEQNAAEFIAQKLKEQGYPCDRNHVRTHQEATGKYCPHRTMDLGFDRFMTMIRLELSKIEGGITMSQYTELKSMIDAVNKKLGNLESSLNAVKATANAADAKAKGIEAAAAAKATARCPDWAIPLMEKAISLGAINGDGKTPPNPHNVRAMDNISRVEMVGVLNNLNLLENSEKLPLSDWAAEPWKKATVMGLVDGSAPAAPLSREQLTLILAKLGLI